VFSNFLGAWIKVGSIDYDRFWVTFLGQTFSAYGSVYAVSTVAPLVAAWFKPTQRATATAIGLTGIQVIIYKFTFIIMS